MPYPNQAELLGADPLLPWIDKNFIRPDPYSFASADFRDFALHVSNELKVDPNGVFCIGSGAVGLSLNPEKVDNGDLKRFNDESDFDVAIVSELFFEQAWRDLRLATQPTVASVDSELRKNLGWQKKRFFDGAILAEQMLPWLSFGGEWTSSLVRLSEYVAVQFGREIDVNIWIFRDYWSVRNYVAESVIKCKAGVANV
ncbi:hypothetical protein [Rathayibacter festucae]|uniref:hypothetical protein n=1 Tax=Rathayibacter festucae TaxID=110937 RepID=UPI002A6A85DF|nr:hypothetical protein [Rathayibacter festucae]MDY0912916.1 hypothetical protein [Rathayibacter festucae]